MWNRVVKCGKTRVKGGRLSNTVSGPCCALTWWTVLVADPEADSAAGCHQGTRVPTKSLGLLWESWARSGCGAGSCPALSMAGRKVKLCPTSLLGKRKRILLLDWRLTQWPLETECRSLLEERAQWACLLCVETCLPQALLSTPPRPLLSRLGNTGGAPVEGQGRVLLEEPTGWSAPTPGCLCSCPEDQCF